MAFQEVVYRPVFGRILAAVTVLVCALGAVVLFWTDAADGIRYVWPIVLVAFVAWALFWRPSLTVQEHGITVVNVLRTHFVPWPAITAIDTRYALTLHTVAGRVGVWAAPAPGRHRTLGLAHKDFDGVGASARGAHGSLRPADAITTPTGNLAQVIRGRWEGLRDAGAFAHGVDRDAMTATWHWATIITTAALAAATLIGLLL
ncbi:PH domain-containing protein [Microbacterium sp. zg.B48]|uniref:PH domain-containing protein n=1 Tax=unclassified Microbacterium TaxID=2609290 RepID=UPI00214BD4E6|nr:MULTISPECIES: PH domain-containing protein [unclassified Microbacterium]MCR2762237.1 PH domain-containing protein [Microbacterium sp. zg.B48]MCR2809756.1 PH domain-containing protein [Microbacterium sp. zg.B185]WIM17932.1 PH domain-containing protein [Microbacterium sp. zg-B185]